VGLHRLRKNTIGDAVLKGHDFSRADKTNQVKVGFSRGGRLFHEADGNHAFFRSLFSPTKNGNHKTFRELIFRGTECQGATLVVP
jgi:hypothetical protein